ncbi:sulfur carrier protein ThiS [Allochromatium tepidum]|uniref:Sulfur carrier protein ThiS n=1 Tax=Allochromatium tepidum TaxID=553982 RepID=A0ABN6GD13_9GAMM|nr:sulfur carrier protein ThiS [Allochromatium tepidum]BCU07769.1 sulfur carrier protein ThiS [Allochromatium tepidum]
MKIILNGAPREIADDMRVSELVEYLELLGQRFAIEVNAELVPRSRFAEHRLAVGDRVEIIQAVGGG